MMRRRDFLRVQESLYQKNDRLLEMTVESEPSILDSSIRQAFRIYRHRYLIERLSKLEIENMDAIIGATYPTARLKEAGINTIGELSNFNRAQLEGIPGIGEVSADKILLVYKQIEDSMSKELNPRIVKEYFAIDLLKLIYAKLCLEENQQRFEDYKLKRKGTLDEIGHLLRVSRDLSNSIIRWFFVRKNENTLKIYEALKSFDITDLEDDYQSLDYRIETSDLFEDFENRSAEYYAVLDALKLIEVKEHEYIDDPLVQSIEALNLNKENLKVRLRGYQEFAAKYMIHQKRTLIGDEMGLGKTIEALAAMNHLYHEQDEPSHFLVICPLSVLINWRREINKWSILPTYIYHGQTREFEFRKWRNNSGVMLTTFDTAKNISLDQMKEIDLLVVDEAHYIKNPDAQRTQAAHRLSARSKHIVLMSGTPLENRVSEMIFLISMLQNNVSRELETYAYLANTDVFRRKAAPVYLRRNREDVLTELPEIEMHELWVPFSRIEYEAYLDALSKGNFMAMRRAAWTGKTRHQSPKLDALVELCEQAESEGRKVLVFSFFKDVLNTVHEALSDRAFGPITGAVSNQRRQELIDEFTEAKPGSVLISQIMAGGVGLNIQAASVIIICEPQYKPSTENQAISRAYRMGQTENVLVYRILTEESIDESMMNLLYSKDQIFDAYARDSYVAETSKEATNLSSKETQEKILHIEKQRHAIRLLEKEKQ